MNVKTTPFGKTDMNISRIGFGAWAIGGPGWYYAWGDQSDNASIEAIHHAVESGVNWIDTAAAYGLGHSERVVAQALRGFAPTDRPYVFTKCGLIWDSLNPQGDLQRVAEPESIRRECEASLERLGVEQIDLYQVHWPPAKEDAAVDDYWATLLKLKQDGKVRAIGLSNHDVHQLEAAGKLGAIDSLQPPFSAIKRDAASDLLPWCHERDIAVIVYSPMEAGLLTGTFTAKRAASLGDGDWRSRSPEHTGTRLKRNLALAKALGPIAARHGVTPAAVAVAWTLAWPGVTGAIVGARHPSQVDGWLSAASIELTSADLDDIHEAIQKSRAGSGPAHPDSGPPATL